ncbi:alpha/beta hydrolase [Streptomyces botrytidirepellens]|uniref:Alpha/beta hydrolase n=1 Tax=Streptomyces botrytidirepellens TaxID=2486417 RepID=A0A3M8W0D6_9ACTN|nr:alpha/beta hydrolase [Streptomyces botrytidirepellens]
MNRTPAVFIHGAWFHMSCWEGWAERFAAHGFAVCVPGWPGEAPTVAQVRRDPGPLRDLGLDALTAHYAEIVRSLGTPPVLIGHSAGGLVVQQLIGAGLGRAAVALAPVPVNGVVPAEVRTRPWSPVPAGSDRHQGFVSLPPSQFRHTVANTVGDEEAAKLFERHVVPAPRRLLADLGLDRGPHPDRRAVAVTVDTDKATRGPLLLVSGQEDRMVADVSTRSVYKLYGDSTAVTGLKQYADRGHSLVVDSGWPTVAAHVLAWLAANGVEPLAAQDAEG